MLGVDLGLNVGSVVRVKKRDDKWIVKDSLVLKMSYEKEDPDTRIEAVAGRFLSVIIKMARPKELICIEEPVLSWRRRNPQVFARAVAVLTLLIYELRGMKHAKFKIVKVNNREAKKASGYGHSKKPDMIRAYKKHTGMLPGSNTKYGQETLADSYFIAIAGYEKWAMNKEERKS